VIFASVADVCFTVASKSQAEVTHNFAAGDMIEVCEGELIHLQGRVIRIDGNKITMLPKHEDLKVCCRISLQTSLDRLSFLESQAGSSKIPVCITGKVFMSPRQEFQQVLGYPLCSGLK